MERRPIVRRQTLAGCCSDEVPLGGIPLHQDSLSCDLVETRIPFGNGNAKWELGQEEPGSFEELGAPGLGWGHGRGTAHS